eukprot:7513560-Lingulodinium_polyedra.AAC.1
MPSSLTPAQARQCMVSLSSPNEKDLSSLARRVTRSKRTGDLVRDQQQESEYITLTGVVDTLQKFPVLRGPCRDMLQSYLAKVANTHDVEGDFAKVSTLDKLDQQWTAAWLLSRNSNVSMEDLSKAKTSNADA